MVYDGSRGSRPLDFVDVRDYHGERYFYIRVTKTFG